MVRFLISGVLLFGCTSSHTMDDGGMPSADAAIAIGSDATVAHPDASTTIDASHVSDAAVARDATVTSDATMAIDAGPFIDPAWVPLTEEQAICLGLDNPTCATCHIVPGTMTFVLRPTFAPPPPAGVVVTPGDCGL